MKPIGKGKGLVEVPKISKADDNVKWRERRF